MDVNTAATVPVGTVPLVPVADPQPVPAANVAASVTGTGRGEALRVPSWPDEVADPVGRRLQFEVDDGTGRIVVRVTDPETGEVVRAVPAEEALRVAARIGSARGGGAHGLLVDETR